MSLLSCWMECRIFVSNPVVNFYVCDIDALSRRSMGDSRLVF
jgi:hypothetical protein